MVSPELKKLLELREELADLYLTLKYRLSTSIPEALAQQTQIAERGLAILREWPEQHWPLEAEEEIWPDQSLARHSFELGLKELKQYEAQNASGSKYNAFQKARNAVFASFYYYRPKEEDIALEDE